MHKDFYASGFLYHSHSQQILLQKLNSKTEDTKWSLFEKKNQDKENPEETFSNIIYSHLHLKLKPNSIYPIYNYTQSHENKNIYIYYGKITKLEKLNSTSKVTFSWFTFKQIHKLNISEQTRQDIIIGQRVIDSASRKKSGERTIG